MEIIVKSISTLLISCLVVFPILIEMGLSKFKIDYKFLLYLCLSIAVTFSTLLVFGWWSDYSTQLLLLHYDYDLFTMGGEKFKNVAPENIERVKVLLIKYYGVGWVLKVLMIYVLYIPYIFLVYFVIIVFRKLKGKMLWGTQKK
ncbi:hypothetical protein [Bernardetia sp.]|uniref:hypothetical protein n=1 Tax=Bernardetia sp. TaxID=1937974 RepID=UPI0025B9D02F|nr:hypothetical protein [Bernardetia sp.]